jgi:hypothetical protein
MVAVSISRNPFFLRVEVAARRSAGGFELGSRMVGRRRTGPAARAEQAPCRTGSGEPRHTSGPWGSQSAARQQHATTAAGLLHPCAREEPATVGTVRPQIRVARIGHKGVKWRDWGSLAGAAWRHDGREPRLVVEFDALIRPPVGAFAFQRAEWACAVLIRGSTTTLVADERGAPTPRRRAAEVARHAMLGHVPDGRDVQSIAPSNHEMRSLDAYWQSVLGLGWSFDLMPGDRTRAGAVSRKVAITSTGQSPSRFRGVRALGMVVPPDSPAGCALEGCPPCLGSNCSSCQLPLSRGRTNAPEEEQRS